MVLLHVIGFGDVRYQAPEVQSRMIWHINEYLWQLPEMHDLLRYGNREFLGRIENLVHIACGLAQSTPIPPPPPPSLAPILNDMPILEDNTKVDMPQQKPVANTKQVTKPRSKRPKMDILHTAYNAIDHL